MLLTLLLCCYCILYSSLQKTMQANKNAQLKRVLAQLLVVRLLRNKIACSVQTTQQNYALFYCIVFCAALLFTYNATSSKVVKICKHLQRSKRNTCKQCNKLQLCLRKQTTCCCSLTATKQALHCQVSTTFVSLFRARVAKTTTKTCNFDCF